MSFKDDFASMLEASEDGQTSNERTRRRLKCGETVEGTIIQMGDDFAFVDVGLTVDARIERGELLDPSGTLLFNVGDKVSATVLSNDDVTGPVLARSLGKGKADDAALRAALESGVPVEGTVAGVRKGGFDVSIGSFSAFCPISQMDVTYVSEPEAYVGSSHLFRIQEITESGRNIVVSRRAHLEAERAAQGKELLERLAIGADAEGLVTRLQKYGAFVDLGGFEGLIHISELANRRIGSPDEVVSVGERVKVRVLEIERPTGKSSSAPRIRLSLRALAEPTQSAAPRRDEVLTATVTRSVGGGLLADTSVGSGLIPKNELDLPTGMDHRRAYPVGTQLQVVSLGGGDRLRFSVRRVAEVEERKNFTEFAHTNTGSRPGLGSFGELLSKRLGIDPPSFPDPEPIQPSAAPESPAPAPATQQPEIAKQAEPAARTSGARKTSGSRAGAANVPTQRGAMPPGVFVRRRDSK